MLGVAPLILVNMSVAVSAQPAEVQLESREIRAGDLSAAAPNRNEILLRFAANGDAVELTADDRRRLLRNRYPGLALPLLDDGAIRFVAGKSVASERATGICYATRRDIGAGEYILQQDLGEVDCEAKAPHAPLGYDRSAGAIYAAGSLPAFTYVGAIKASAAKPLRAGSKLTLRTVSGPVTVERDVWAMQAGRPGDRLFVKTSDGEILASRLSAQAQTENSQ